eukprot:TRINITY_DN13393_c0_g1_i1.p1 TRINITY_DN13393_c0_g1~~TRINITY_DN13393_c0_g1_i1.p1  ORF type:complete len:292 (-),score=44.96 TRINITY_DN13393_c0_g1_i1:155-1030(-)
MTSRSFSSSKRKSQASHSTTVAAVCLACELPGHQQDSPACPLYESMNDTYDYRLHDDEEVETKKKKSSTSSPYLSDPSYGPSSSLLSSSSPSPSSSSSIIAIVSTRFNESSYLLHLPDIVWSCILSSLGDRSLCNMQQVCRVTHALLKSSMGDLMWKEECMKRWTGMRYKILWKTVGGTWYTFYKRRIINMSKIVHQDTINEYGSSPFYEEQSSSTSPRDIEDLTPIDNCLRWKYKCPLVSEKLSRTSDPEVDYCRQCHRNVYLVHTTLQLEENVLKGHCVMRTSAGRGPR